MGVGWVACCFAGWLLLACVLRRQELALSTVSVVSSVSETDCAKTRRLAFLSQDSTGVAGWWVALIWELALTESCARSCASLRGIWAAFFC